jgi:hypothetical protein
MKSSRFFMSAFISRVLRQDNPNLFYLSEQVIKLSLPLLALWLFVYLL